MITYTYNGQGKRIQKTVNGTTSKYYYDGDELILEKTSSNSIYYIHSPRLDELIEDSRGYSYHYDGLGSVVNLTNSAGTKANSYTYKAFGSIRSQSGSMSNQWLFTGRQLDPESGLYFYRNRYYDARVGRFTTQDPSLTLNPQNRVIPYLLLNQLNSPLELQRYLYCINNPVNLIDPFGLEPGTRDTRGDWYFDIGYSGFAPVASHPGANVGFQIGSEGLNFYWGVGLGAGASLTGTFHPSQTLPSSGTKVNVVGRIGIEGFGIKVSGSVTQRGPAARAGFGVGIGMGISSTVTHTIRIFSWDEDEEVR